MCYQTGCFSFFFSCYKFFFSLFFFFNSTVYFFLIDCPKSLIFKRLQKTHFHTVLKLLYLHGKIRNERILRQLNVEKDFVRDIGHIYYFASHKRHSKSRMNVRNNVKILSFNFSFSIAWPNLKLHICTKFNKLILLTQNETLLTATSKNKRIPMNNFILTILRLFLSYMLVLPSTNYNKNFYIEIKL